LKTEESQGFSKRKIEENTRKYDLSSDSDEEPPDFDYLLKLPPSTGSHFLLKSEQERFNQELDTSSNFSKYFNLDIKTLNLAMNAIPFHERHDLKSINLNSGEIQIMKDEAEANEILYREHLEKVLFDQKEKQKAPKPQTLVQKVEKLKIEEPPKTSCTNVNPQAAGTGKDKESIQKWLDDILDI
jgi:hypothetical protein